MFVKDDTIQAEGLTVFIKNVGRNSAKAGKKMATIAMNSCRRAFEIRTRLEVQLYEKTSSRFFNMSRCEKFVPYRRWPLSWKNGVDFFKIFFPKICN